MHRGGLAMRHMLLALLAVGLLTTPAVAQSRTMVARVTQVDLSAAPDVTIGVSVSDADSNPVTGLALRDFVVTEDGRSVGVTSTGAGNAPISAALVIDRSGSMEEVGKMVGAQEAARAFIDQLRPTDSAALIAFDTHVEQLQAFTADTAALRKAVRQLEPNGSTALYDSIVAGVTALKGVAGRRALIVLTDGQDRVSTDDASPASTYTLEQAIEAARASGLAVQVIGLGARNTADSRVGIDEVVLRQIADQTGGQYIYAPDAEDLMTLYRTLANTLQHEYQLSYVSPRAADDLAVRDIRVTIRGAAPAIVPPIAPQPVEQGASGLIPALVLLGLALLATPLLLRRRVRDLPPTPRAATGATRALVEPDYVRRSSQVSAASGRPQFCDQCGSALHPGMGRCEVCGSDVLSV